MIIMKGTMMLTWILPQPVLFPHLPRRVPHFSFALSESVELKKAKLHIKEAGGTTEEHYRPEGWKEGEAVG